MLKIDELNQKLDYLGQKQELKESDIASSLFKVAVIYKDLARTDDALSYFMQSLELNKQILDDSNHPYLAAIINNVGLIYYEEGKYDEALKYYNQSLEMFRENEPIDYSHIGTVLNNIGAVYQSRGKLVEAINCYKDAFEEYKRLAREVDLMAGTLINMGSIFHAQGQSDRALAYLYRALEIYRKASYPGNHLDIATVLNNIGGVYMNKRMYEEALRYYNESLEIKRQTMPANHPRMDVTFDNIGNVYKALGQFDEALKYFKGLRIKPIS